MFPIQPAIMFGATAQDTYCATRREFKQPSRLDIQRCHLEHKKMYHIDIMTIDQRFNNERDLVRRQMLAEARSSHGSVTSKVRHSIGQTLISIGERIRPEFGQGEPTPNA